MNKIRLTLFILLLAQFTTWAADYSYAFLVSFTDKENSSYSVDKPEAFLSQRSIDRRIKYDIAITQQDLPVNQGYIQQITDKGGMFHNDSKWMNSAVFYSNDENFDKAIKDLSIVASVSLVYNNSAAFKSASKINKFESFQENSQNAAIEYGDSENQISMCNAQYLHNLGYEGEGMQVAVIDAGFYHLDKLPCFKPLFDNGQILATHDFVNPKGNIYESDTHGTSVMSVIAANQPGVIYGSASKASYYLLRSEDAASEFRIEEENWIAAAEFADSAGVDVISTSLGYSDMDDSDMSYTYEDMDGKTTRITQGSEIAFSKGMVLINSAGNSGLDKLTAPSDGINTLAIGAVDAEGEIAYFSSRGPSFDGRVKPDVSGQGVATAVIGPDTIVHFSNGTSFSCPLVAGMITCLWQANPTLTNVEITNALRQSGDISKNPDDETGYGIPDMIQADNYAKGITSVVDSDFGLITVFPNPATDRLTIDWIGLNAEVLSIDIYNAYGSKVWEEQITSMVGSNPKYELDAIANWPTGLYLLQLKSGSKIYTHQIIKP